MAKLCVQCNKKIGLFSKPIEGIYCSYACRDAGRQEILDNERRSKDRLVEAEQAAARAKVETEAAAVKAKADAKSKGACPKCDAAWRYLEGGGKNGLHAGSCDKCGLSIEFSAIERCPICRCQSLVVEAERKRCPRCKYRGD